MYARLQTTATRPQTDNPDKHIRRLIEVVSAHPGYAGLVLLEGEDQAGALLTLWHTREDAELASERSRAATGPRMMELLVDDVYEVVEDIPGRAAAEPPAVALTGFFDGPLSPARAELARRRGQERIKPALAQVPGLTRTLVLWHGSASKYTVVHLATSPAGLQQVTATVMSVPLAEGDDPALLTGPDRVETHQVVAYEPA
ncbi:hypothetical protein AB0F81_04960 [Actinoplanes sp. NPDC024001]|uniref:hypothetical protein n=1 Tax=Actinoplanes sp. NPDC024001 TaxID=3154598 RepID=UPI0033FA2BA9